MAKRDGFIIHEKTLRQMSRLTQEDAGYLLACLSTYYWEGEVDIDGVAEVSVAVAVILEDAVERMEADKEAFEKSVEQRRQAAEKRWSDTKALRNDANSMRDDATALRDGCETDAKNAVSVSVSDSVSVKEKKKERFTAPTVEEVRAYCMERHNSVDAEAFVAFYESKGWKVGNASMKNWKSAVVTWEKRQKTDARSPAGKFANFPQRNDNENRAMVARLIAMQ